MQKERHRKRITKQLRSGRALHLMAFHISTGEDPMAQWNHQKRMKKRCCMISFFGLCPKALREIHEAFQLRHTTTLRKGLLLLTSPALLEPNSASLLSEALCLKNTVHKCAGDDYQQPHLRGERERESARGREGGREGYFSIQVWSAKAAESALSG